MKKNCAGVFIIGLSLACLIVCAGSIALEYEEYDKVSEASIDGERHERITQEMIMMLDEDPELKAMMEESIAIASVHNPDQNTNPVQSLETYYDFLDWSARTYDRSLRRISSLLRIRHPREYGRSMRIPRSIWAFS